MKHWCGLANPCCDARARERPPMRIWAWRAMLRDVRYAMRQLAALARICGDGDPGSCSWHPGAATAIFSAVYPILFEPLPYPPGARIVTVSDTYNGARVESTRHFIAHEAGRAQPFV